MFSPHTDARHLILAILTIALVLHLRMLGHAGPELVPVGHPTATVRLVAQPLDHADAATGVHTHTGMLLTCIALAAAGAALLLQVRRHRSRLESPVRRATFDFRWPIEVPEGRDPPPSLTPVAAQVVSLI